MNFYLQLTTSRLHTVAVVQLNDTYQWTSEVEQSSFIERHPSFLVAGAGTRTCLV